MPERTYTTHDIARFCDVYPSSVHRWISEGRLPAYSTPGGHQRVTRENLVAFLKELGVPLPRELAAGTLRVLIVDDDVEVTRVLSRAFARRASGVRVEVCHDGIESLIRIGQEAPDLVILDVVLPKMDGMQVCRVLKSQPATRGIKIVAISGKNAPFNEKKPAEAGVDAFFRKPLDVLELLETSMDLLRASKADAAR